MLKIEDAHYTGERDPAYGDKIVHFSNTWPDRPYYDRHGVIARSVAQLDAIEAVRGAISATWDVWPEGVCEGRVMSAVTLPDSGGAVTVAAWNGTLGWVVYSDGRVTRSRIRYETDGDYNIYEVPTR